MITHWSLSSWDFVLYTSSTQPFWHQGPVSWKTFFPWTKHGGRWFQDDSSTLHLLWNLFLLLLRQLHLRSSGIGAPEVEGPCCKRPGHWKAFLEKAKKVYSITLLYTLIIVNGSLKIVLYSGGLRLCVSTWVHIRINNGVLILYLLSYWYRNVACTQILDETRVENHWSRPSC